MTATADPTAPAGPAEELSQIYHDFAAPIGRSMMAFGLLMVLLVAGAIFVGVSECRWVGSLELWAGLPSSQCSSSYRINSRLRTSDGPKNE